MLTVGVDLAAEAARTAVATLDWGRGAARLVALDVGADDAAILEAGAAAACLGVDCPVGWPAPFVDFVAAHAAGRTVPPASSGRAWRRTMTLRRTDIHVHAHTGLTPLSVSADLIGHAALRWAVVESDLAAAGVDVSRDGSGGVAEVYPAAALKAWGLSHRGYKRANTAQRVALVQALTAAAPWLDLGVFAQRCRDSDDAFDAVVCALVARAVVVGGTRGPEPDDRSLAVVEGWIHVPTVPLDALVRNQ